MKTLIKGIVFGGWMGGATSMLFEYSAMTWQWWIFLVPTFIIADWAMSD